LQTKNKHFIYHRQQQKAVEDPEDEHHLQYVQTQSCSVWSLQ